MGIKECTEDCWRLVHDNYKVLDLFRASALTRTEQELECFDTQSEAIEWAKSVDLDIPVDLLPEV